MSAKDYGRQFSDGAICRRSRTTGAGETPSFETAVTRPTDSRLKEPTQAGTLLSGELIRTYKIGLGLNPVPDKQREGDRATPEGEFYIFTKNPRSAFHLSLGVSYPNIEDAERGLKSGLITRAQRDTIVRAIKKKQGPPQYTALGGLFTFTAMARAAIGHWAVWHWRMKTLRSCTRQSRWERL